MGVGGAKGTCSSAYKNMSLSVLITSINNKLLMTFSLQRTTGVKTKPRVRDNSRIHATMIFF